MIQFDHESDLMLLPMENNVDPSCEADVGDRPEKASDDVAGQRIGGNQVSNWSFEDGLTGWRLFSPTSGTNSARVVNFGAAEGQYCVEMNPPVGVMHTIGYLVRLKKGAPYNMLVSIKSQMDSTLRGSTCRIRVLYVNASDGLLWQAAATGYRYNTPDKWFTIPISFTIPDDAESQMCYVCIDCYAFNSVQTPSYADFVWVEQSKGNDPPWVYGMHEYGVISEGTTANVTSEASSSSGTRLGTFKAGAAVKLTGEQNGFAQIVFGKRRNGPYEAYVPLDRVTRVDITSLFITRMRVFAQSFVGHTADAWDYTGSWCQNFLNNIAISSGLPHFDGKLPPHNTENNAGNTWHALEFLRRSGYVSEANNPLGEIDEFGDPIPVNGVHIYPTAATEPKIGDWVYFLSKKDALDGYHTSHVEVVTGIDVNDPYWVRTVGGDVTIGGVRQVAQRWFRLKNMKPALGSAGLYGYYYVAHGHPFWQA